MAKKLAFLALMLLAQSAVAATWYLAPIQIEANNTAQQALTKEFTQQLIKTIKINEYQVGKPLSEGKDPKWVLRTKLIPLSQEPLVGKKGSLTKYGKGEANQEIVAELLQNGVLVAHIGQGWREPLEANTKMADKFTIVNHIYAIGAEAKAADLEELAAQICFEAGKVIARNGKPLPEKKPKEEAKQ